MAEFTAKDVQALRVATGAGMMDAKRALTEADGDPQAATKWLRERGLGKAAERAGRESEQGAVAVSYDQAANAIALVQLRSETDFGAKSPDFVNLVNELAALVASEGEEAVDQRKSAIEDLNIALKENVQLGEVVRFQPAPGSVVDSYLHVQHDRGVNGVIVELAGGAQELAHDVAVHCTHARLHHLVSCSARTCLRKMLKPSGPRWRPRHAWKANLRRRCPRSSKASSTAGSSGSPAGSCWSSRSPRTTAIPWRRSWDRRAWCASPRW